MWSYVGKKAEPRWLWHAIDHHSGTVLAYVFGRRTDEVFLQLHELIDYSAHSPHHSPFAQSISHIVNFKLPVEKRLQP